MLFLFLIYVIMSLIICGMDKEICGYQQHRKTP
jgi:hypothetical protein